MGIYLSPLMEITGGSWQFSSFMRRLLPLPNFTSFSTFLESLVASVDFAPQDFWNDLKYQLIK